MSKVSRRVTDTLEAVGAQLKRAKKHLVYQLPNGRTFVVSKTPSDSRTTENALSDLRRVAGVDVREPVRKTSADVRAERRHRPGRAGSGVVKWGGAESPLALALRETGLVERQLRTELEQLRAGMLELTDAVDAQAAVIRERERRIAELEALWTVRLLFLWRRWRIRRVTACWRGNDGLLWR